jgi:hypothetical protein
MKERSILLSFVAVFLVAYSLPLSNPKITNAILEAFKLLQWYARNHTLACVIPALFIAGGIVTFLSKESVLKHLGPQANKIEAYSVASLSGTVLAVCSCSVLPMFAGIYRLGAGLGPAAAFLYSGPAINVLALFLTARVLGFSMGLGRAVGTVAFAFIIGLLMEAIFRGSETERIKASATFAEAGSSSRPLWKTALYFLCMIAFLVFSDWYNPGNAVVKTADGREMHCVVLQEMKDQVMVQLTQPLGELERGEKLTLDKREIAGIDELKTWVTEIHAVRWYLAGAMGVAVLLMVWAWFTRDQVAEWMRNTWDFAKLLIPLLFGGVFLVGFLGALLPDKQVAALVGDNSLQSNLVASVVGCLFYFATLTEIPILEALMKHGMAQGPAMALLLAGPALSLPSILVIRSVLGTTKTAVFTVLVVAMATLTGIMYGTFVG